MVIWPACRMGQYRINDHPYHAPQFIKKFENFTILGKKFEVYHYIIIKTYRAKFTSHSRFEISSVVV